MIRFSVNREISIRVIADALMVNCSLLLAVLIRFMYYVGIQHADSTGFEYRQILQGYVLSYRNHAGLLSVICIVVFYLSGFYTYGRAYTSRYKAMVVVQAVTIGYIVVGFLSYFWGTNLDRTTWVLAWLINSGLLLSARVWASVWRQIVRAERHLGVRPQRRVRSVLIIGGAGYIGSALLPRVLERGYKVRLLDLLVYGVEPIQNYLKHPGLEVIQADFRQVDKVVEAVQGMDAVVHLGAIVGDPACALDRDLTIEVNLMATRMIAEVARGSGIERFIFASSCSVYGASELVMDERSDLNPVSLYARSKIASEQVLMNMARADFSPTCLRFATIYGLSGRTRFDLVVNLLTAQAVVDGVITIIDGEQWRSFLHVDDAAAAVFKVLQGPQHVVRNQIFNVGSSAQNYTIQQMGEIIQAMVPSAKLVSKHSGSDPRNYRVNFSKVQRLLDFVPEWTIEQGVRQVIDAIRSGRVRDYRDPRYSNVVFLARDARMHPENGWASKLIESQQLANAASLAKALKTTA